MHHLVTPLAVALVGAVIVAGCGSPQNPSRPTTVSRDANALSSHPPATEFGTLTAGALGAGSTVDLAACLDLSPAESCFSAMPATVLGNAAALSAPSAPSNLVATAVGGTVTLRWTPPAVAETAVVSYIIEAGSFPGAANLANFSTGNAVPSFFASGVGNGTYYVRVRAVNSGGPSAPSNEATLIVGSGPCTPPGPPSALAVVSNSGGTVVLSWLAAAGSPTSYVVEAGSSPGLANLANSDLGLTTTLTASGVGVGTYYVRIRARNGCGTSGPSNEIVLTVVGGPNRTPVIGALTVSPQGIGLQSATIFTFLGQNVSDPDGDTLTYSWLSSDSASITSSTQAASHVYARSGIFQMRLTVTDRAGLSASATVAVSVGTVTGVWDVSCDRSAFTLRWCSNFPTQFVATLTQSGDSLLGSMTGGGRTNRFTLPGKVYHPREFVFGVESFFNVWCPEDYSDFYFRLNANDTLTSGTSSGAALYCRSASARKR